MQMTGAPPPLPRAPSRGFRDKPQRNYNAFDRHAPVFSTNVHAPRVRFCNGVSTAPMPALKGIER